MPYPRLGFPFRVLISLLNQYLLSRPPDPPSYSLGSRRVPLRGPPIWVPLRGSLRDHRAFLTLSNSLPTEGPLRDTGICKGSI